MWNDRSDHDARDTPTLHASELLLDLFMPAYDVNVIHCGAFGVRPRECHEAVLSFGAFDSPLIRGLIHTRGLPDQLLHWHRRTGNDHTFRVRDLTQEDGSCSGRLLMSKRYSASLASRGKRVGPRRQRRWHPRTSPASGSPGSQRSPSAFGPTRTAAARQS